MSTERLWFGEQPREYIDAQWRTVHITVAPGNGAPEYTITKSTRRAYDRELALRKAEYPTAQAVTIRIDEP